MKIYDVISRLCWGLGLLSMLAALVIKWRHLAGTLDIAPHTGFVVASALFLCALATRDMSRTQ
jgi:hypothetical protein